MARRPSKIDRLPDATRDLVAELRKKGRTIDEIHAKLEELNVDIARSSVGRHIQHLDTILEMTRESRRAAEIICEKIGADPDNRTTRANVELLHALIMRMQAAEAAGEVIKFEPQDIFFLSKSIHSLASAAKVDLERDTKLRERIRAEEREKAERAAREKIDAEIEQAEAAGGDGAYMAALKRVREDIYGIYDDPGAGGG
ncbi:MAG: DUF3486 family protein [Marivibrio sp.]|uniref:phage protein Gp27 family protein n=1 Tax=Marivibrio sp. TaxID=2039719 RepID=UPI0032EE75AA